MRKGRRRVLIRLLEISALSLGILDILIWLLLARPYQDKVVREEQRFEATREQMQVERARLAQLQRFETAGRDGELQAFLKDHMPPRRRSFSRATLLLWRLTQQSGVELSAVGYRLASKREEPLEHLGIDLSVLGPFSKLLDFAHAVESASDFILVRSFILEPASGGALALRLAADLYLTP